MFLRRSSTESERRPKTASPVRGGGAEFFSHGFAQTSFLQLSRPVLSSRISCCFRDARQISKWRRSFCQGQWFDQRNDLKAGSQDTCGCQPQRWYCDRVDSVRVAPPRSLREVSRGYKGVFTDSEQTFNVWHSNMCPYLPKQTSPHFNRTKVRICAGSTIRGVGNPNTHSRSPSLLDQVLFLSFSVLSFCDIARLIDIGSRSERRQKYICTHLPITFSHNISRRASDPVMYCRRSS